MQLKHSAAALAARCAQSRSAMSISRAAGCSSPVTPGSRGTSPPFMAPRPAMNGVSHHAVPTCPVVFFTATCAAASRAMITRNGEQLT